MTANEAHRLFQACQEECAEMLAKLAEMKAEKARLEMRKGDLYRQWTTAQATEKRQKADQRANRYQAPRNGNSTAPAPSETIEERTERIINEQHEKNMRLEAEGKW